MYDIRDFTFVEHPVFTRQLVELVGRDDETYRQFQLELALRPEGWPVVKGTGGLRKARMGLPGRGKSGGAEERGCCVFGFQNAGPSAST